MIPVLVRRQKGLWSSFYPIRVPHLFVSFYVGTIDNEVFFGVHVVDDVAKVVVKVGNRDNSDAAICELLDSLFLRKKAVRIHARDASGSHLTLMAAPAYWC